jgi:hypothetical protein
VLDSGGLILEERKEIVSAIMGERMRSFVRFCGYKVERLVPERGEGVLT